MAKKFLVALLTLAILFVSIAAIPVIKADTELQPDIITDKIIILNPEIVLELQKGILGIMTFSFRNWIGFDVPGGNLGTDLIVTIQTPMILMITNPVGLKLVEGNLYVYFAKNIDIVSLPWNVLSISEVKPSWFPRYLSAQIVNIEDTGASESETDYCCYPVHVKTSYYYKLYLTTNVDPYSPPTESEISVELMIPDYFIENLEALAKNHDYLFIGVNGDNQIYLWLSR